MRFPLPSTRQPVSTWSPISDELIADIRAQLGADHGSVVVDTLNRSIAGSESKRRGHGRLRPGGGQPCERRSSAPSVIIHHCGINGERPRGHTSLTGACDAQIAVKRDAEGRIVATVEHMKDGVEGDTIHSRLVVVEVGTDEDGEAITSCIVEPAEEGNASPKTARLTAAQTRALKLLIDAVAREGELPPESDHIPPDTRCVSEDLWRRYCYLGGISGGEQHAKNAAFNRSARQLVAAERVGKWATGCGPSKPAQTGTNQHCVPPCAALRSAHTGTHTKKCAVLCRCGTRRPVHRGCGRFTEEEVHHEYRAEQVGRR